MEINVGTKIVWESAAGISKGTVSKIFLKPAADGKMSSWMIVDTSKSNVMLNGTDAYLKMMKVKVVDI